MENIMLPQELSSVIGSERIDFSVKAGRAQPLKKSLSIIFFGAVWTAFTSVFVIAFLGPLFLGKEVRFDANGVPAVASPDNLGPIVMPAIIIGVFVLIGMCMLSWGFYSMFRKGGYFVGTPARLVHFQKGRIRSIDWEQFSGDIEISGNDSKGGISLRMRTGKMVSRKNGPDRYVPDVIYISEIPHVFDVEKVCRRRIKENDPTPPASGSL
ncbi:MAG: hypothetical protein JW902_09235 [Syntrophaceae bacterium]|nr:hypothetical protein [Syntrophaceae bacterium]